jgi:hypothetical protein
MIELFKFIYIFVIYNEKDKFGDLEIDEKIILKSTLSK